MTEDEYTTLTNLMRVRSALASLGDCSSLTGSHEESIKDIQKRLRKIADDLYHSIGELKETA
ncbi:MAG: hypothetical protein KGL39_25645 [Patescibacteria group bacterium]|nr:hypothetical protein [Patescibacteria group bacterium]